jgi:hypothetical protein
MRSDAPSISGATIKFIVRAKWKLYTVAFRACANERTDTCALYRVPPSGRSGLFFILAFGNFEAERDLQILSPFLRLLAGSYHDHVDHVDEIYEFIELA